MSFYLYNRTTIHVLCIVNLFGLPLDVRSVVTNIRSDFLFIFSLVIAKNKWQTDFPPSLTQLLFTSCPWSEFHAP